MSKPVANAEILLESGTNELEVLVFTLGEQQYGVNVAKVREVILPKEVAAAPDQHPAVVGMFNLRGGLLPLIDLHRYFEIEPVESEVKKRRIIVTEFNGVHAAFMVDRVDQIYRMSWSDMKTVPEADVKKSFAVTGITEIKDQLTLMLDFESIVDHINMHDRLHIDKVENKFGVDRESKCVWIAEDSNFIRDVMQRVLSRSGYQQVVTFRDGLSAWQAVQEAAGGERLQPDIVITDIEMPQMDGLHLTRRIKQTEAFASVPVLLFSSLIATDTRHKGDQVGADGQIGKPDLPDLVELIDRWLSGNVDQDSGLPQAA